MRYTQIADGETRSFALVFEPGDEVVSAIAAFAKTERVHAGRFTGIGGFSQATLQYFDREKLQYEPIPVGEQVEVVSLIGDVARKDGEPAIHAHAAVAHRGGSVSGGHLLTATVWPTLEVFFDVYPEVLVKTMRPELGIATIDFVRSSPE